jgi:hypothetical protein
MRLICLRCWNSGVIRERVRIPRSELSDVEVADQLVQGGYAYRNVERPCHCGRKAQRSTMTKDHTGG